MMADTINNNDKAILTLPGHEPVALPIVRGTAGDPAIDITSDLRKNTGYVSLGTSELAAQ